MSDSINSGLEEEQLLVLSAFLFVTLGAELHLGCKYLLLESVDLMALCQYLFVGSSDLLFQHSYLVAQPRDLQVLAIDLLLQHHLAGPVSTQLLCRVTQVIFPLLCLLLQLPVVVTQGCELLTHPRNLTQLIVKLVADIIVVTPECTQLGSRLDQCLVLDPQLLIHFLFLLSEISQLVTDVAEIGRLVL